MALPCVSPRRVFYSGVNDSIPDGLAGSPGPRSGQVSNFFTLFTGFDSIAKLVKHGTREWTDNKAVLPYE